MFAKKNGFTLIELVVAMAVGAIIMSALYAAVNMAQRASASVGRKVVTQQDARTVLNIMAMEIRMVSYNPAMTPATWDDKIAGNCSDKNINLNRNLKGILEATDSRIAIAMDLDGSTSIGDNENEYIVYNFNNNTESITRSVSCGGNQNFLGGSDSETKVKNGEINTPLFVYYDRNGDETNSIPDIRRIRITIVADTKNPDSLTGESRRMTYTTDVLVKNHVLCP
jgi:prepilin-type N-terminal cleavage/methylation domain-containing protein